MGLWDYLWVSLIIYVKQKLNKFVLKPPVVHSQTEEVKLNFPLELTFQPLL